MLKKCMKALLITDVTSFAETYQEIALDIGVELTVAEKWDVMYRLNADTVILGSKYLEYLNASYYDKAVVILKKNENPSIFMKMGITRFIFDYTNTAELTVALFKNEAVTVHTTSKSLEDIIRISRVTSFCFGEYEFRFDKNYFGYKGKPIYLCDSQKVYLAEWLLNAHKDNGKRMVLCNLRKKFGHDFLSDVNRFGQIRRSK